MALINQYAVVCNINFHSEIANPINEGLPTLVTGTLHPTTFFFVISSNHIMVSIQS